MGLTPKTKQGKVTFYRSKIAPWNANATAIGTTVPAVTALDALVVSAQAKLDAQVVAQDAARSAVSAADAAVALMAKAGADVISAIRTKARTAGDGVYDLAQIPAPHTPSTRGNPGTPFDFKIELQPNGTLMLKWKCANPPGASGTIYQVYRRAGADADFKYVGGSGLKDFLDATVPAGATRLTYQVQAVRSTVVGVAAEFNVNFGTAPDGHAVATLAEATAKLAA